MLLPGSALFRRICDLSVVAGAALLALQATILGGLMFGWERVEPHAMPILAAGCLAWLLLFVRLPLYRRGTLPTTAFRVAGFFSAPVVLTPCWFALAWLQEQPRGELVVFLLLLIIWASDTGAYFAGKQYEEDLGRDEVPSSYLEYLEMLRAVFAECVRTLEPGGRIAVLAESSVKLATALLATLAIPFHVSIAHTPLPDTEDTSSPYRVAATIVSAGTLEPDSLLVRYSANGGPVDVSWRCVRVGHLGGFAA